MILAYSLLVGILIGFVYGYSFVLQQKSIFSVNAKPLIASLLSIVRVIILGITFTISLRTTQINPILVAVTSIVIFWIIILIKKASLYARS